MKNTMHDEVTTLDNISENEGGYTYPIDYVDWRVLQTWKSIMPSTVWMNEDCTKWGTDKLASLHQCLQALVNHPLPTNWLSQYTTAVHQSSYLRAHMEQPRKLEPYTLFNTDSTGSPLCLIHPAIVSAYAYYGMAQFMQHERPLLAIHCQQDSQKNYSKLNGLDMLRSVVTHHTELLLAVQPQGDYHLGGWSLGGLLSIKIAESLQKRGRKVASLSLIDPFFAVQAEADVVKIFFNQFGEGNKTHPVTQYSTSLTQRQLLRKHKKFLGIELPMIAAFDFGRCDVPTLIIQAKDTLIEQQANIAKYFPTHKLIQSDFEHCSMMGNDCSRMTAQFINDHIKENS